MGSVSSGNSSSASMAVIHPIHNPAEGAIIVTADTSGILRVYENLHSDPLYYFSPGSRLSVSIAIPANEVQLPSAIPISPSSNAHIISVSKISSRSLPPDNSNVVLTDTKPKSTISSNSTNGKVQQDHTTSVNMYATASRKSIRSPPDSEAKPANSVNNINRKSETS